MEDEIDPELRALLEEDGENKPLGITGSLTGPRTYVSPTESRRRRVAMSQAMMEGYSRDQIMATFTQGPFFMTESGILDCMREVRARWIEEDQENASVERSAAKRRLERWIGEAAKDRKWPAVAALEKVHADITGNSVPVQAVDTDQKTFQGVIMILAETTPEEFRRIVERERLAIDTEGEEVRPALPARIKRSG